MDDKMKEKMTSLFARLESTKNLLRNGRWYDADKKLQGSKDLLVSIAQDMGYFKKEDENT